jgi:hypothetical protein
MNLFPLSRCASATKIFCPLESTLATQPQLQPALLRLSAMTSQNFTLIELCRFLSPHGNDKVILTSAMRRASAFTITKKSLSQLRLTLPRVASQTTKAFSHCYTSLKWLLKAKWQRIRPPAPPTISTHVYEIRPRADKHGIDLISDVLPYSPLWYAGPNAISNAISFARFNSRSHDAVIRVYDEAGNVVETHEHT